jgi:hypothetical protein
MDPDQDRPPWVPSPRTDGGDTGGGFYPVVPAPRVAPALERLPGRVATLAERPVDTATAPSTALVPVARRSTGATPVPGVPDVPGVLCTWARAVSRLVHAAVDGVRSLVDALVPAPAPR